MKKFIATTLIYCSFLITLPAVGMEKSGDGGADKKSIGNSTQENLFRAKNCKAVIDQRKEGVFYTVDQECSFHNFVTFVLIDYCSMNRATQVTISNDDSSSSYTINEANCRKIYTALNITAPPRSEKNVEKSVEKSAEQQALASNSKAEPQKSVTQAQAATSNQNHSTAVQQTSSSRSSAPVTAPVAATSIATTTAIATATETAAETVKAQPAVSSNSTPQNTPLVTAANKAQEGTHVIQFYAGNNRPNVDKITCTTANASLRHIGNKYYYLSEAFSYDKAKSELSRLKEKCASNGWIRQLSKLTAN